MDAAEYLVGLRAAESATASKPEATEAGNTSQTRGRFSAKRLRETVTPTLKNARSARDKRVDAMRRPKQEDPPDDTQNDDS